MTKLERILAVSALAATAFLNVGCPSLSTLQTPRTVPEGEVRFAVGAETVGLAAEGDAVTFPQVEFGARYGVAENFDVGAKIYLLGAEIGMKWQFLRGGFDMAVAPAISFASFSASDGSGGSSTVSFLYLHLPFLMGANLSDRVTLSFGPKFMYALIFGDVTSSTGDADFDAVSGLFGGLYLGLPIRLGSAFWIAPEINVYTNLVNDGGDSFTVAIWQGGLGFYFGGPEQEEQAVQYGPAPPPPGQQSAPPPPPAAY